jgi:hypothetical protein
MTKDSRTVPDHFRDDSSWWTLRSQPPRIWPNDCPRCATRMELRVRPGGGPAERRTLRVCPACLHAVDSTGTTVTSAFIPATDAA